MRDASPVDRLPRTEGSLLSVWSRIRQMSQMNYGCRTFKATEINLYQTLERPCARHPATASRQEAETAASSPSAACRAALRTCTGSPTG